MFFAISKITFDLDTETTGDGKQIKALVQKIRANFKVCVKSHISDNHDISIVVATLAKYEKTLHEQLDSIAAFCEESGFARIGEERTLIDDVDAVMEEEGT